MLLFLCLFGYLVGIPVLIFSVAPDAPARLRKRRMFGALAILYISPPILLLLCGHYNGAAVWATFGWLPAFIYIGWWELAWRIVHQRAMSHGILLGMGDDCLSNSIVSYSLIGSLIVLVMVDVFFGPPLGPGINNGFVIYSILMIARFDETIELVARTIRSLAPSYVWALIGLSIAPALAFSARPDSPLRWRATRNLLATSINYSIMLLAIIASDGFLSGATWGTFLHGWYLAGTYTGWWELAWRIRYRKSMNSLCMGMGDDFFNNAILAGCAAITTILLVGLTAAGVHSLLLRSF